MARYVTLKNVPIVEVNIEGAQELESYRSYSFEQVLRLASGRYVFRGIMISGQDEWFECTRVQAAKWLKSKGLDVPVELQDALEALDATAPVKPPPWQTS